MNKKIIITILFTLVAILKVSMLNGLASHQ